MDEFKRYHPIVNFVYFVCVIGFSMFYMHPATLGISFISGFIYSLMLNGKKALRFNIMFMFPIMLFAAIINVFFNHQGITVIAYLPGGNPLTAEALYYGLAAALMIGSVVFHFSCYNSIMTSDKFIYLFGKIIPSLSLVFSMVLRFVPRFKNHLNGVVSARKGIGKNLTNGNIKERAKSGSKILSAMTSWALENSIETADSMKSRGYGLSGRTTFSNFKFVGRDFMALALTVILAIYVFAGRNAAHYEYFPAMSGNGYTTYTVSVFVAYFLLQIIPVIVECVEVGKWILLKRKI